MANKKTFTDNLDTSPVNKFITRGNQNIQTTTEKLREQPQPETAKERADVNADQNRATPHRNKKAVNEMYFRLFKDNTGTFVDALLCLNCGLWYPGFELTLYPDGTKGYWPVTCYEPAVMNSLIEPVKQYHQNIERNCHEISQNSGAYRCINLI